MHWFVRVSVGRIQPQGTAVENLDQESALPDIVLLFGVGCSQLHPIGLALEGLCELPDDRGVARLRDKLTDRDGRMHEELGVVPGVLSSRVPRYRQSDESGTAIPT